MKWIFFIFIAVTVNAQNTIGTISHDPDRSLEGFNLFWPTGQSHTFLIDNCGRIINIWTDGSQARSGIEQYLLEDGSLLKAKSDSDVVDVPTIGAGGAGGVIERRSWDNELLWQYIIQDSLQRQHHDIHPMPNGNVLAIVWDRYFLEDIVTAGFDTSSYTQDELWPDKIVEIDPATNEIVWQWKAWDHIIQDRFSDQENFGVINEHPELIDINYQEYTFNRKDWTHINGIDYNETHDQVLLSVRNFNEIWILDHSTSTEEASGHTGGNSGKGGDILFRWGNPEAYQKGSIEDKKLFFQHDPEWVYDPTSEYHGMIILYNNFIDLDLSLGTIIDPMYNPTTSSYELSEGVYLPESEYRNVSHPDTFLNYSTAGSNIELLPNGNFMMHAARPGFAFELTDDEQVIWEYRVPLRNGFPVEQGSILAPSDNFTFSLRRYPIDFPGFDGKDISPKSYLELNPDVEQCFGLVGTSDEVMYSGLDIYPNPVKNELTVSRRGILSDLVIYSVSGLVMDYIEYNTDDKNIDVSAYPAGLYFIKCKASGAAVKFSKI